MKLPRRVTALALLVLAIVCLVQLASCLSPAPRKSVENRLKDARDELAIYLRKNLPLLQAVDPSDYPADVKMTLKRLQGKIYMLEQSLQSEVARRAKTAG